MKEILKAKRPVRYEPKTSRLRGLCSTAALQLLLQETQIVRNSDLAEISFLLEATEVNLFRFKSSGCNKKEYFC